MGKRVHVAKKYVVKWSDADGFNWKNEEFKDILRSLGCNICEGEDGYDDDWEVDAEEYKKALDFLRTHKKDIFNYEESQQKDDCLEYELEDIYDAIMSGSGYETYNECYKYVLVMMRAFWRERDKKCEYMHFSAF